MKKIKDMLFGTFLVLTGSVLVLMFSTGLIGEPFVYVGSVAAALGAAMVFYGYFSKEK